jgi:tripartite-type tricarboxylate transporter receptor subunit TctC
MRGLKRAGLVGAALLLAGMAYSPVRAQSDYPNKIVRLVVGFPAGSSADIAARAVAARMSQGLGQQVIVESRPGAGSSIAAEQAARADKDGYTLFMLSSANITNQAINPALSFKVERDFAPIALVSTTAVILVTHPSTGAKSLKDLIALARSKPGELNYASTGVGTAPHLSGELLSQRANIKIQHVPYKGSPEAATDLLAGRVNMMFSPASAVIAQVKQGGLSGLATATDKRLGILPDLPTMEEAGMPDFNTSIWFGLVAPVGTPKPVIDKLAKATAEATAASEVIRAWELQGIIPLSGGPDVFGPYIASEIKRWDQVAAAAGLKK